MIIDKITIHGLRKLYEYYADIYKEPSTVEYRESTQKEQFLKYLKINMIIGDISPMEYFVLTRYMGNSVHFLRSSKKTIIDENIGSIVAKYNGLISQLEMDTDYNTTKNDLESLFGFPKIDTVCCTISITGIQILNLFKTNSFLYLMRDWLGSIVLKRNKDGMVPSYCFPSAEDVFDRKMSINYPKQSFEDFTISAFIKNFYLYYADTMTNSDLVTNAFIHNRIHTAIPFGQTILTDISSPVAAIQTRNNVDMADFPNKINTIKDFIKTYQITKKQLKDEIHFSMTSHQPLYIFLRLSQRVPFDLLQDFTELKVIYGTLDNGTYVAKRFSTYNARITQYFSSLHTYRDQLTKKNNYMDAMNYVPYMTPVHFTISGSLHSFHDLCTCVDEETNLTTDEISFYKTIKNCLQMIENSFEN